MMIMKQTQTADKNRSSFQVIFGALIPFLMKEMVILPISFYWWLLGIGLIISILLIIINKKLDNKRYYYSSIAFSVAVVICLLVYPAIKDNKEVAWLDFKIDSSFREPVETAALSGDKTAQELIGSYYVFPWVKENLKAKEGTIKDDELFDIRDFDKGTRFLEMAASQHSSYAFTALGEVKIQGLGCLPSRNLAIDYFKRAYELDNNNKRLLSCISYYHITRAEFPEGYNAVYGSE